MSMDWFDDFAGLMEPRIRPATSTIEFVVGVRLNAAPHAGTYLILASSFVFASRASARFGLPSRVRIHFLDNDPVPAGQDQPETHFHCVFQARTTEEGAQFIDRNYLHYLTELGALTGCSIEFETYSLAQGMPAFRAVVLDSCARKSTTHPPAC